MIASYLFHHRQDPGLSIVSAVGTDTLKTQKHQSQNRAMRSSSDQGELTRSTFSGLLSALQALARPKRGSSGAWGTRSAGKLETEAILGEM